MIKPESILTERNSREEIYSYYLKLIEQLDAIFNKIALNHYIVPDCIDSLVNKLYHSYKYFIPFSVCAKSTGRYIQAKNALDTAVLSIAVAVQKKLSLHTIEKIIEAALLHDAGMLCIPHNVLDKSESLSKSEYWYILTHPLQSSKIIEKELRCSEQVSMIVSQHHEAWNGKGYPKKLAGNDIVLEARIISVASAFVAMNSERSYRPSLGRQKALSNLIANAGVQFDPDVVKVFVHLTGAYSVEQAAMAERKQDMFISNKEVFMSKTA